MDYIFFGIQGSGKGTQTKLLAAEFNFVRFETGAQLRAIAATNTELGKKIKNTIDAGQLVSDEMITSLLSEFLEQHKNEETILFDGLPRNANQYPAVHKLLHEYNRDYTAVEITLSEASARARLLKRAEIEGRKDDTESVINQRIEIFRTETAPLLQKYKEEQKYIAIDGEPTIEECYEELKAKLNLS